MCYIRLFLPNLALILCPLFIQHMLSKHLLRFRHSVNGTIIQLLKPLARCHSRHVPPFSMHPKVSFTFLAFLELVYFFLPPPIHSLPGLLPVPHNVVFLSPVFVVLKSILLPEWSYKNTNLFMLLSHLKSFSDAQLPSGYNPSSWVWHRSACTILPLQRWAALLCQTPHAAGMLRGLVSSWCLALP